MSRKRTGMRRKNFAGRRRQRRIDALERLLKYDKTLPTDGDEHLARLNQIAHLNKLIAEDSDER